ncbi:DUF7551 domain-containing protein [Halorussus marinus]|uniref:DUF7551 domain-containing protein n=1 Tax=Halorussus marinus TaxID=2505976 RepID=UPI0010924B2B|nr:hypothetical protein [Halorussus marinus]
MVGTTLRDLRERIADDHEDGGRYYVACARTGERPVPVAGKRFPDRATAEEAARAAAAYRAELRQYDPRLPCYDLVVSEDPGLRDSPIVERSASTGAGTTLDFCHDVAAAVFEALTALDERAVERAAMDAYLHSAEAVVDPDDLCLVLLATMATEIDDRLGPDRQDEVLRAAADRLGPRSSEDPVAATLDRFDGLSLVDDYAIDARPVDPEGGPDRSWTVTLDEYAFDLTGRRLPTLPLAVELLRHRPERTVAVTDARPVGDGAWRCVVTAGGDRAAGLANAVPAED